MPSIADLIVRQLRGAGIGRIFGMPGGGSNLDLIDAAGRAGLPFVLTSSETAGALAAMAQAEVSGRPGVCLTTLGPGVASVINGVACAWLDRAPLLVFTDGHPVSAGGIFEHQRLDHRALLAPVTKWSVTLSVENAGQVMREAIDCAMADPPGPVHIEWPADLSMQPSVSSHRSPVARRQPAATNHQPPDISHHAARFEHLIAESRRPLFLVGLGARRQADAAAIRALCASHNVPAMVTYKAKGVVPDADRHFAGVLTNGAMETPLLEESDLLIGVGLDPVELIPRPWRHAQSIVNCGRNTVDDRHVPFAAQCVTDVPSALERVGRLLPRAAWDLDGVHRRVVADRERVRMRSDSLVAPQVVDVAAAAAPATARVTVDAGAHMFPSTLLWPVAEPNRMLISNGLSTMGFALPAAIGAALQDNTGPVFALTGDGGLLMCVAELLTAVRERLHVIVIVFSDASLSLIDIKQRQRALASAGVSLGAIAWPALAESFGAAAHAARTETELASALARALDHRGPSVIEARVDPAGYADTLSAVRG